MAILKKKELQGLPSEELKEKLQQIRNELSRERGAVASGIKAENPGNIGELRRTVARIKTVLHSRGEKL